MWIYLYHCAKNVDICVLFEFNQIMTSAEKDFKNHMDRIKCSMDTSQPLCPKTLVIAQWNYIQVVLLAGLKV